jgi:steroid delta-isomerase-like uncharacterized protein
MSKDHTESNKALLRQAAEQIWNRGNFDAVDKMVAPNSTARNQGEGMGREDFKQLVKEMRAGFPDLSFTIDAQVAEGDQVVTFATLRGTHKGEFRGLSPTGNKIEVRGSSHTTVQNGQVVQESVIYDQLAMITQLGVKPESVDLSPRVGKY